MKEARQCKQLQTLLTKMLADLEVLKTEIAIKQREQTQKQNDIERLRIEISKLDNSQNIKVSEHAIIRYFERVKGFNIEDVEKDILSDSVLNLIDKLGGNGKYPNKDFSVVMKDFTVVTIL